MPSRERDELELVPHRRQILLEAGDGVAIQVALPVERRRAVVREELPREDLVHTLGKAPRFLEVRRRRLTPEHVGIGRVRYRPRDGALDAAADPMVAFGSPLAVHVRPIARVHITRQQRRRECVGARDEDRRNPEDIGGQSRRRQRPHELRGRNQNLAAHVPAFLL